MRSRQHLIMDNVTNGGHVSAQLVHGKEATHFPQAFLDILEALHKNDWLHNDLHPQNIFLHFPNWDWDVADMGQHRV